jgi:2-polyprenyl-3-methyl-5-hydroxy-6-metoxy-1,4-benzoquinol methylase
MGVSNPENKPWIQEKIKELNPSKILDVGAGAGIYLDITRNALGDSVIVDAIEVWNPYIEYFNLRNRYNNVYELDVREFKDFNYDLVVFGDVLEHMSEEDALKVWKRVSTNAKYAIISIPIIHYHQDAINGNPYEVHVEEDWDSERVLDKFSDIVEYKEFSVTGTFIAKFRNNNA